MGVWRSRGAPRDRAAASLTPVLLLAFLCTTSGYTHLSAQYKLEERFAWSLPADFDDHSGLGGGIAYAIEPDFCERLLPKFREQTQSTWGKVVNLGVTFVDCEEIADALARAFTTWASNHHLIHFKDVTSICTAGGLPASSCSLSEVTINAMEPQTEEEEKLAAFVLNYPAHLILIQ